MKNLKYPSLVNLCLIMLLMCAMTRGKGSDMYGFITGGTGVFLPFDSVTRIECRSASTGVNILFADTIPFFRNRVEDILAPVEYYKLTLFPDGQFMAAVNDCRVIFDGKDPSTGERKKELAFEPLFSYTSPRIKPYLPGRDLLEAEGKMIRFSGGYIYLMVHFQWNANDPDAAYGRLKANGAIRCILTNNKTVTLYNSKESGWQYDKDQNTYNMEALFLLHPRQIKLLKKLPVMNITIYWERGYEDYPIYPITFFMNQIGCLD